MVVMVTYWTKVEAKLNLEKSSSRREFLPRRKASLSTKLQGDCIFYEGQDHL